MLAQLSILAPGLLGSSLARAARARGLARRIVLWARRPETRLDLRAQPWCDEVAETPEEAVRGAELVVLCPPVTEIVPLAARIAPALAEGAIVTDVGSTKAEICRLSCAAFHERVARGVEFVGSHPMAGSEKTGHAHGTETLFEGRPCFLTPLPETPDVATDRVAGFWRAVGSEVVTVSPDAHDEIVAHISHLPHLLAVSLCHTLASKRPEWRLYAGPGLRDTTRVASGDPAMWRAILEQNREEILRALRGFQSELDALHAALSNQQWLEVRAFLERGKQYRDAFRP